MKTICLYFEIHQITHLKRYRFFDSNASGLIRGRLDAAAADTETLLAHNLADIVGTITTYTKKRIMKE